MKCDLKYMLPLTIVVIAKNHSESCATLFLPQYKTIHNRCTCFFPFGDLLLSSKVDVLQSMIWGKARGGG